MRIAHGVSWRSQSPLPSLAQGKMMKIVSLLQHVHTRPQHG